LLIVLATRSIPALSPPVDRDVLRAVLARAGRWARTPGELSIAASDHYSRILGQWAPHPEEALCQAIADVLDATGGSLAVPAWSRPGFREVLPRVFSNIHWMEPAEDCLDPGASEVREALAAGARAVLLAPIAGNCAALPEIEALCAEAGALFAVDARASVGSRMADRGPESFGDLLLVPGDGEPGPSLLGGAVLFGSRTRIKLPPRQRTTLRRSLPLALRLLAHTVRYEPRLRSLWRGPRKDATVPRIDPDKVPRWAFAAAQAKLHQSNQRWSQRARHVRTLHMHCSHLPGTTSLEDAPGAVTAGAAFPVLVPGADLVRRNLARMGVKCVPGLAGWLAPKAMRGPMAEQIAEEAIFLPLHPFYRPEDMGFLTEALRRAVLRSGGGAPEAPAPALEPLESHEPEETGHPALRVVSNGAA